MDELTLTVVGIDFPNQDRSRSSRRMELLLCPPGEPVELRPEPKNAHDGNAVAVFSARGVQVGYLTAERAPWIGRRLQGEEYRAVFQMLHGGVAHVRVRFGGGDPTLPATPDLPPAPGPSGVATPRRVRPDPDAFYPDEEGPAWGA